MFKKGCVLIAKMVLIIVPLLASIEHFLHEMQPKGRADDIPGYDHIAGPTLRDIPTRVWVRGGAEPVLAYVSRITRTVHYATYHCLPQDHSLSWIETVGNTAAKLVGYDSAYNLGLFRFSELRCGYCSERAAAATKVLRENGIDASTYGLGGHVVSRVVIDGNTYFTDPDYGVGPYPADLDFGSIKEKYKYSVLPSNANLVAKIVTESSGGVQYFSDEYFDSLRYLRRLLHYASNAVASCLVAFSLFSAWFFCPRKLRSRYNFGITPEPSAPQV